MAVQVKVPISTAQPGAIFTVFVIAGLIAFITLIEKQQIPEGTFLALLVFLIIGALVPPVAIIVGAIIVFYLLLTGGATSVQSWLTGLVGSNTPTPSGPPLAQAPPSKTTGTT